MQQFLKRRICDFLVFALLGFGIILVTSPLLLYWWIHGSYERYIWIISGPAPYDKLGGGPYQLFVCAALFFIGILLIGIALILKRLCKKH